jgi:3-oxoacid CoA-transferase A subunit
MSARVYTSVDDALDGIDDGVSVMFGGFVSGGTPSNLILALKRRGTKRITAIANNIGLGDLLDELCEDHQLERAIATFAIRASGGRKSRFEDQYRAGEVALELVPQGTFAERIRAAGAGLGGVLTRTGIGTLAQGEKQLINLGGEPFLLESPLRADVAFVKAYQADRFGNLVYRRAGRNFNPVMATAADLVIAEVEEIVDEVDPERVETPSIYVDRLVECAPIPVRWTG